MRDQALVTANPMLDGSRGYLCEVWEKSAAGIERRDECQPDVADWQGFGWSMLCGAIAYGLLFSGGSRERKPGSVQRIKVASTMGSRTSYPGPTA
jgi:hypothetical protein